MIYFHITLFYDFIDISVIKWIQRDFQKLASKKRMFMRTWAIFNTYLIALLESHKEFTQR